MYTVQISPLAKEDLIRTKNYLDEFFGSEVAESQIKKVIESITKLQEYPLMGRPLTNMIDVPTDYMYFVVEKNYVFYRVEDQIVRIIRILNSRQDFLKILFE